MKAAVLTISDGVHHGTREDKSGDTLAELLEADGLRGRAADRPRRAGRDRRRDHRPRRPQLGCVDNRRHRVLAARRHAGGDAEPCSTGRRPGIAEAIRADALTRTPHAMLSRGLAGLRGATLIVNMPGSPGGCRDGFAVLQPALVHGLELAAGDQGSTHKQT